MKIIGLTGPSGAGKGSFARALVRLGADHIDTDALYHNITSSDGECNRELSAFFGKDILNSDGSLNRMALAAKVFCGGDEQKKRLKKLNAITHKYVIIASEARLALANELGRKWAVIDAPLLIEAKMNKMCDFVVAVIASKETRILRIMARDGIDRETAERRINAQHEVSFYMSYADYIIENNGGERELDAKAAALLLSLEGE